MKFDPASTCICTDFFIYFLRTIQNVGFFLHISYFLYLAALGLGEMLCKTFFSLEHGNQSPVSDVPVTTTLFQTVGFENFASM